MRSANCVMIVFISITFSLQILFVFTLTYSKSLSQAQEDIFDLVFISDSVNLSRQIFQNWAATHAMQNLSLFGQPQKIQELFWGTKAIIIIVQPPNISSFFYYMSEICSALNRHEESAPQNHERWKPYVFLLWPKNNTTLSREDFENGISTSYKAICFENGNCLTIESQLYIMVPNFVEVQNAQSLIFELYSIQNHIILKEIPFHNRTYSFQPIQRKLTRRHDFMGTRIRSIALSDGKGYSITVNFKGGQGDYYLDGSYDFDYFNLLASSLNASTITVKGKGFMLKNPNGSLIGMGKQLLDNEGEIIITHSEYLLHRFQKLSFLHPHHVTRLTAYFQQPTATATRDIYLHSIPNNLRFAIVCTSFVTFVCLTLIGFIDRMFSHAKDLPEHSFSNIMQWMITVNCQQGMSIQPVKVPVKIVVLVYSFFNVLVYIAISTSVVSQLSVPFVPIKNFEDILKTNMKITLDGITHSAFEYLEKAKEEKRLDGPRAETVSINPRVAVSKIINERLAFLSLGDEFYLTQHSFNYTDKDLCKFVSRVYVDPIGLPVLSGMYVSKASPYKEFFKYKQTQMREVGLHDRLFDAFMTRSTPSCQYIESKKEVHSLGLNDTITAFIFLIAAFLISVIALCIERAMRSTNIRYDIDNEDNP